MVVPVSFRCKDRQELFQRTGVLPSTIDLRTRGDTYEIQDTSLADIDPFRPERRLLTGSNAG